MKESIIVFLERIVARYRTKGVQKYMCNSPQTRNRNKRARFQIPFDKPQCPVFKDNRCCGDCGLSKTCKYAVNCGCFGFAYAALGGSESTMMKPHGDYSIGRLKEDGEFDWEYYREESKRREDRAKMITCKFCNGTGKTPGMNSSDGIYATDTCKMCSGEGKIKNI